MSVKKALLLLQYVLFFFHGTIGTLTEVPENQVLSSGNETVVLRCHSSFGYNNSWYANGKEVWNSYYLKRDVHLYLSVERVTKGACNLLVKYNDAAAQTYLCKEPGSLQEASAEVICIESDLFCVDSSTEDLVNLTCAIEFRGNWAPMMEWKERSSHDERVLSVGVNEVILPNERVTSTLVMEVQEGSRNYVCTAKFHSNGKPHSTTATNVPHYNRIWMSSVLSKAPDQTSTTIIVTACVIFVTAASIVGFICVKKIKDEKAKLRANGQEQTEMEELCSCMTGQGKGEDLERSHQTSKGS